MMKGILGVDLNGKVVVITGAAGVICGVMIKPLLEAGAKVALLDINKEKLEQVTGKFAEYSSRLLGVQTDVLNKGSLQRAHEAVYQALGPCDILLNGAGGNHPKATTGHEYFEIGDLDKPELKTFFDLEQEGIDFVFKLNFLGSLLPTQIFASDMIGREGCCVINISSMNAYTPLTKIPAYSGAKAAISNFTQWLAVYFSKVGIRVNAMAPGFFLTEQNHALLIKENGELTERAHKIINSTPMGRFGEPEELIGTLMYLVDPKLSGFVNGVVIPIDGAFSAYSGV